MPCCFSLAWLYSAGNRNGVEVKFLVAVIVMLVGPSALARGEISLTNSFLGKEFTHAPALKFSVDEQLIGKFYFEGFSSLGSYPTGGDIRHWGAVRAGLSYREERFAALVGVSRNAQVDDWFSLNAIRGASTEEGLEVKMSWTLW